MGELVTLSVCWEMLAKMMGIEICCMHRARVRVDSEWWGVRVVSWVLAWVQAVFTERGNRAERTDFKGRIHAGLVWSTPGSQYILN